MAWLSTMWNTTQCLLLNVLSLNTSSASIHTSGWRDQSCSCAHCNGLWNMTRCCVYVVPWGRSPVLMATPSKGLCKCGNHIVPLTHCSIERILWPPMVHEVIQLVVLVAHMLFADALSKFIASFQCILLSRLETVGLFEYLLLPYQRVMRVWVVVNLSMVGQPNTSNHHHSSMGLDHGHDHDSYMPATIN